MRAAICYEFGKPLVVEDVTLDPPQAGEVRVKIVVTGVCHSDLHAIGGEWTDRYQTPLVVGHESAGTVQDVGAGVTQFKPGDRVIVTLIRSCGRCFYCLGGHPQRCDASYAIDRERRLKNARGQGLNLGMKTGSFADAVVVHESQLCLLPDDVSFEIGALLACGVITGAGAVLNTAEVKAGSSVVVIGAGGVGLNSIQAARIAGAYPIVAVDVLDNKLEMAHKFGATHSVNPKSADAIEFVKGLDRRPRRGLRLCDGGQCPRLGAGLRDAAPARHAGDRRYPGKRSDGYLPIVFVLSGTDRYRQHHGLDAARHRYPAAHQPVPQQAAAA